MNEEEVKVKLVLPWLLRNGVDTSEIHFEYTFTIQLGRHKSPVDGTTAKKSGRLDMLVSRGSKNLFIVEVKASHLALTDKDRDQAISYARLVHPIAPYAIVMNGNESRLFDVVSKEQIDPSTIQVRGFQAHLPDKDIEAAQQHFLSLSTANLQAFCNAQASAELGLVRGTIAQGRKYVPELHEPRLALHREIDAFLTSSSSALIILAESGSGKTCELCALVERLLAANKPVLYFNGISLKGNLLSQIAEEFSWTFSTTEHAAEVIKRVERIIVSPNRLTIAIDAIDEWHSEQKSADLASVLRAIANKPIKLIATCKLSSIELFLERHGTPTQTSLLATRTTLQPLSSREFSGAVDKYRAAYEFSGSFEDGVLKQARSNPFFMRVLFDVAQSANSRHLTFSSREFFDAYFDRAVRKTSDPTRAANTLTQVAAVLFECNAEWIGESELRRILGLSVNEALMHDLFDYGVLVRTVEKSGLTSVSFYVQQLRDYVIAFKALNLQAKSVGYLTSLYAETLFPSVRGSTLSLYYRLASNEHRLVFDKELRTNANEYLHSYVRQIDQSFPALKRSFEPRGEGRIGFVAEIILSWRGLGLYGFRRLERGDADIYFVPAEHISERSNLTVWAGGEQMHHMGSCGDFRNGMDVQLEVRKNELLRQVEQLIETGQLNESVNPDLATELVLQEVLRHPRIFGPILTDDGKKIRYPLALATVLQCITAESLSRQYLDELVAKRRASGEIKETRQGDFVSFSYAISGADERTARERAWIDALHGKLPSGRVRYQDITALNDRLQLAVEDLREAAREFIPEEPPLIEAIEAVNNRMPLGIEQAKIHVKDLYTAYRKNYRSLIELNFPTLKHRFSQFADYPVATFLVFESTSWKIKDGQVSVRAYWADSVSGTDTVEVVKDVQWRRTESGFIFTVEGREYQGRSMVCGSTPRDLCSGRNLPYARFRNVSLRSMVYATIREELGAVKAAFLAMP